MKNKLQYFDYYKLLLLYIVIQPIIDIFTAFFLLQLNISITPGLIIRNGALLAALLYVFIIEKKHRIYFVLIAFFYGVHLLFNTYYKEVLDYYEEISYFSKYVFFIAFLIACKHIMSSIKHSLGNQKLYKALWISLNIISICIIFAALTGTGIQSYGSEKIGQTGWFFSGTKISAAMAILFPVALLYTVQNPKYLLGKLILIVSNIAAMFITGTKTSYMGIILGLLAGVVILALRSIVLKEAQWKKILMIFTALLVGAVLYTPYSPVYNNIRIHQSWNSESKPDIIFNGREIKADDANEDFKKGAVVRKFIGVGYGGDYEDKNKVIPIERDFHELFYYYGVVGLILLLYYPGIMIIKSVVKYLMNFKSIPIEETMLMTSLVAGLGCGFIAGHVLFAPSVSVFLTCTMITLWKKQERVE